MGGKNEGVRASHGVAEVTDRDRAIDAMCRASAWAADVARVVDDAREAAAAGDMDRAAALLRAAVTAVTALRHDIGYARIAVGRARDTR